MKLFKMQVSLVQRVLLGLFCATGIALGLSSLAAYDAFEDRLQRQKQQDLMLYARERTRTEQSLFNDLRRRHAAAAQALARNLEGPGAERYGERFDTYFPLRADGTRRSIPALFEGDLHAPGNRLYGLGAFFANGAAFRADERALWVAAADVLVASGASDPEKFDNLYFFTPEDRLLIFGPEREDRLMFYRETAPATLSFAQEELVSLVSPANNPQAEMRCTRLERRLSDPEGRALTTGCHTPVYLDGHFVGAFGTTLDIGSYLHRAVNDAPEGAEALIVAENGDLIAFPGFLSPGQVTRGAVERFQRDLGTTDIMRAITASRSEHGVIESPDGRNYVAFGRLGGPDWYLLITTPRDAVAAEARSSTFKLLLGGGAALLLQALLAFLFARGLITDPIRRLAKGDRDRQVADIEARSDEIGALARNLSDERRQVRDLTDGLERRVRERTAELEQANQAKSAFLANMSHELRTPLNGVVALSDLLRQRLEEPENQEMATLIVSSGRLLEQVVNDILDVSKIEAGHLSLETRPFDVGTMVRDIASLHAAAAAAKGLTLDFQISPRARGAYVGDPVRLTQILSNLLSNAVKFTETGRVTLRVMRTRDGLRFSVRDTGIGFEPDQAARLFKRFEQADPSTTRRFGGTGLGLSISGSLASMMGGGIRAFARPGVGALFVVQIQAAAVEESLAAAPEAPATSDRPEIDRAVRVLLAEDHPTNQRVVTLILEPLGVDLTIVANGKEALDAFAAGEFDVVLMDVQMPVMDGHAATREIRALEAREGRPRTPVVSLTANALPEHVQASLASGADRHLAKPIRPDGLIACIDELLSGQGQAHAA